jgi:hypothetical protein
LTAPEAVGFWRPTGQETGTVPQSPVSCGSCGSSPESPTAMPQKSHDSGDHPQRGRLSVIVANILFIGPTSVGNWSGRWDSNPRPPEPHLEPGFRGETGLFRFNTNRPKYRFRWSRRTYFELILAIPAYCSRGVRRWPRSDTQGFEVRRKSPRVILDGAIGPILVSEAKPYPTTPCRLVTPPTTRYTARDPIGHQMGSSPPRSD